MAFHLWQHPDISRLFVGKSPAYRKAKMDHLITIVINRNKASLRSVSSSLIVTNITTLASRDEKSQASTLWDQLYELMDWIVTRRNDCVMNLFFSEYKERLGCPKVLSSTPKLHLSKNTNGFFMTCCEVTATTEKKKKKKTSRSLSHNLQPGSGASKVR